MNPELQISKEVSLEEDIDFESLDKETLNLILKEGIVSNLRTIEDDDQLVPVHKRGVLTAHLAHKDIVYEAEINLPDSDKKIKVVYKPESGINKGTEKGKTSLPVPSDSSAYQNKEVASWIVIQALSLEYLATPVTIRDLGEGTGSVRAFFKGQPVEIMDESQKDTAFSNRNQIEDIALVDFVLQTLDRRDANIIAKPNPGGFDLKLIDHSMTFFDEKFADNPARRLTIKGPRLMIAFDNSTEPPTSKLEPLPERLAIKIDEFIKNKDETVKQLGLLLNDQEITGVFKRAQKLKDQNIFL